MICIQNYVFFFPPLTTAVQSWVRNAVFTNESVLSDMHGGSSSWHSGERSAPHRLEHCLGFGYAGTGSNVHTVKKEGSFSHY